MQTKVANGNITPYSIVKVDTSATDGKVILSGAGERSIGISQSGTRRAPGSFLGIDDGYVAIAGEGFMCYTDGDKDVPFRAGGTITAGQRVKSDASGFGVASTTDKDQTVGVNKFDVVSGAIGVLDALIIGEVSV